MTTHYRLNVRFSAETAKALVSGNFSLLALETWQSTIDGGQPVLWLKSRFTNSATTELVVDFSDDFGAYVSASPIVPGGAIAAAAQSPIHYDQTMRVKDGGVVEISHDGPESGFSILNEATTPWTCGPANPVKAVAAFPLYGLMMNSFAQVPGLLVAVTPNPAYAEQCVLPSLDADGFLADFAGVTERDVTFDINKGWDWGGETWGQIVPRNTPLASVLIEWSVAPATSPAAT